MDKHSNFMLFSSHQQCPSGSNTGPIRDTFLNDSIVEIRLSSVMYISEHGRP